MTQPQVSEIRKALIRSGVQNLKTYGYPYANEANILTDQIYKAFFCSMLKDNKGKTGFGVDSAIDELLATCGEAS